MNASQLYQHGAVPTPGKSCLVLPMKATRLIRCFVEPTADGVDNVHRMPSRRSADAHSRRRRRCGICGALEQGQEEGQSVKKRLHDDILQRRSNCAANSRDILVYSWGKPTFLCSLNLGAQPYRCDVAIFRLYAASMHGLMLG